MAGVNPVQSTVAQSDGTGNAIDNPLTAVVPGNTIFVIITGTGNMPNEVTDTNGNTYVIATAAPAVGTDRSGAFIWWAHDVIGGDNVVHVAAASDGTGAYTVQIYEISGNWKPVPDPTDSYGRGNMEAVSQNSVGNSADLTLITTKSNNQFWFAAYDNANHTTPFIATWSQFQTTQQLNPDGSNRGTATSGAQFGSTPGTYIVSCQWPDLNGDQGVIGGIDQTGHAALNGWGVSICAVAFYQITSDGGSGGTGGIDVITDLCLRAGIPQANIDTTLLLTDGLIQPTNVVKGYLINQQAPAAQIIKVLMDAYFFGGCESDGIMKWVPRGMPAALTIPEDDLGLEADKAKMLPQVADPQTLPQRVIVTYNDPAINYQQQKQQSQRNSRIIQIKQQVKLDFPLTLDPDFAKQVSEKALYLAWQERTAYKQKLWRPSYLRLDATDVINFVYEGITFRMRIAEETLGQGFVLELNGPSEDARIYISSAQGGTSFVPPPPPIQVVGVTSLFLFDIPLIQDTDSSAGNTGLYAAMTSQTTGYKGAELDISSDDTVFTKIGQGTIPVTYGYAQNTLGAPVTPWTWDYVNKLTLKLSVGSLAGDSMLNVLNGANIIIVGSEIVQFVNATANADGTVTLDTLLRGRRGTEMYCGTHAASELVVVPISGMIHVTEPLAVKNALRYYKAVTVGADPTTIQSQEFTNTAVDLMPYAPCQIKGTRDGAHNLTLNWVRRTRVGGEWKNGTGTVPLSEDAELYSVDIVSGMTVLRTFTGLRAPTTKYTAAQQTADGVTPGAPVSVNIFQLSGEVGRGFPGSATV